jgi:ligand-binding sensor domain-containing protein
MDLSDRPAFNVACSLFLIVSLAPPLCAQTLLLKNYSTADGLPDSRVAPLFQDRDGYLWFGTQAGLTRYDGRQFETFGPAHEIPGIFGRSILQDRQGVIWFAYSGFQTGGITRYWKGRSDTVSLPAGGQPNQLAEDPSGNIWVAASNGLYEFLFTDSVRRQRRVHTLIDTTVSAAYVTRTGDFYVAGLRGLYLIRGGTVEPVVRIPVDAQKYWHVRPYSFYEKSPGDLWFGGFWGAYRLHAGVLEKFGAADGLPDRGVWCFGEDEAGDFFAGTMHGLYRIEMVGGRYRFTQEPSFGDAVVYDMLRDREGNLWFASAPGIRRLLRVGTLTHFRGEDRLNASGIGPIVDGPQGSVLFGSRSLGVFTYREGRVYAPFEPFPPNALTVTAIAAKQPDRQWFGLWRGGAVLLRGGVHTHYSTSSGLPSDGVHCIVKTRGGPVLIGTAAGVGIVAGGGGVRSVADPRLDGRTVFDIREGTGDTLWFGTDDGVRRALMRGDSLRVLPPAPGEKQMAGVIVYAILPGRSGRTYFGTDGKGVILLDHGRWAQITTEDGLVSDRVFALAQDSLGNLWVGTASGLSCCSGRCVRNLTFDQGFGEIGMHGLLTDRDGNVWVSAVPNVREIRPVPIRVSALPPPVYLTEITVDGRAADPRTALELQPDPAVITFRYAALSFTDERNVRYRYALAGFDPGWSVPVTTREVRYTHLPSGSYRFRLLARSADGVWTEHPVEFAFTILPPMWARWWFLTLATAMIGLSLYAGYRYRLNKILQLQQTRNRIAMDLHDDVGSSLTRISVLTEVARRRAGDRDGATAASLAHIGDIARSVIDSLGDIVWTVDPKHDDLQNVIRRIVQFGEEVCEAKGIAFETELHGLFDTVRLSPEQRRDVYLVFKEGINNVVKHSGATMARFQVRPARGVAILELLDNGSGIPGDAEGGGHGLKSLRERGKRAGIRFVVESREGEGTRISLVCKTG